MVLLPIDRRMKFPVFSSVASAEMVVAGGDLTMILLFDLQRMRPLPSDMTMFELLVKASIAEERLVIGTTRLATQTTVRCGMLLYHMPT